MQSIKSLVIIMAMAFLASCSEGEASSKVVEKNTQPKLEQNEVKTSHNAINSSAGVKYLTTEEFIKEIFDYKSNPQKWVYKGDKPAIIDFYADWCRPCKMVAPIMEELAVEYEGQVNIYKVDTDKEKELAGAVFGIRSIPSILFIPVNGQPTMYTGAFQKQHYIDLINEKLLTK